MKHLSLSRSFIQENLFLLIGACLTLYFGFHGVFGQRGVIELVKVSDALTLTRLQLSDMQSQSLEKQLKVERLRASSLDLDYVEELAFQKLGYTHRADIKVLALSPDAAQQ